MYIVVNGHKKAAPVLLSKLARATHFNLTCLCFVIFDLSLTSLAFVNHF